MKPAVWVAVGGGAIARIAVVVCFAAATTLVLI
jgi:hypothetical protein